ncbi:hypothetical protein DI09_17p50 [Mitosporidium daphniae]|uniref:SANT domain-containing protein n=1 Tax=Mitosporidium daphniae TaxID=1485682 RepID=A0A098VTY2_9MICR|nr:uncharacterized protein DI09_17p50 [Mitosporidium daphniae]KGG52375.1 hypothetical protein DI09_17p50 [Mitosporidium daphniae]|eukprot:XP_013238833.1 uncharacterized protein DI09_17p50 [Mitosporidium daphniae]
MTLSELVTKNPLNGLPMSVGCSKERASRYFGINTASPTATQTPPILSSAPRVTIIDGKLVVDEESLVLDRPSILDEHRERVEETSKWTTSASFRKAIPRNRWSSEDTHQFYQALQVFGTDFEMLSKSLKSRTRSQVKNKFKREERENPARISAALMRRL